MELYLLFAIFLFIVAIRLFFWAIPIPLWVSALTNGVEISLFTIIIMRFKRVPPKLIVKQLISAKKAGLTLQIDALEAHYLAGGNVAAVVRALIVADKESIDLSFERAAAIDLTGKDVLETVKNTHG